MRNYLVFKHCFWALLLLAVAYEATAQTPGACPEAQAQAFLDAGNVRALIRNNGALFFSGGNTYVYEAPANEGQHAVYATVLLVGGFVEGELRTAAAHYGRFEFWPGPLDDDGNPPDDCAPFDRLWSLTSDDVARYNDTGFPTPDLAGWPWHLGAPVVDGDGNPDNYDLDGGDRPALLGDQMLWWVMNDAGGEHEETHTPPIGLDVRGTAFSFRADGALGNTTFYRYRLTYKGTTPIEDAYVGLFADVELGDFDDDYVGSDTTLDLGFAYNADNVDGEGDYGYGENPPAIGYTVLRGPHDDGDDRDNDRDGVIDEPGERLGMETFACYIKNYKEPNGDAGEYYNCLQGLWADGTPMVIGNSGTDSTGIATRFVFPGDPVTGAFWSEVNIDGQGQGQDPADRRFYLSSGPFTMQPGETEEFAFAIVWARGADHLDSVRQLKEDVADIRQNADVLLQPDGSLLLDTETTPADFLPDLAQNFPNPFAETTTIRYGLLRPTEVRLAVYDVLGREVAVLVEAHQNAGLHTVDFKARDLPPGIYVYRIEMNRHTVTRRMTLIR